MKYNTRPIDYTGCHPVIAEHLKRGEAIECTVWGGSTGGTTGFVSAYCAGNSHPYRCKTSGTTVWRYAEPIPRKVTRIMPPERAIPVLIENGWAFNKFGQMVGPEQIIVPKMLCCLGRPLDDPNTISWGWPSCIIEEVDE